MSNFAFFGTSRFSKIIIDDLKNKYNMAPSLIISAPDKPVGRKQVITPPETKVWGEKNNIGVYQPTKLKNDEVLNKLKGYDFFVVASYGKIIPKSILDIPTHGAINVHPSLLPLYRGPSPIQNQILNGEKNIGTTIMLMDEEMDHGPILAERQISFDDPFIGPYDIVEEKMAHDSADLLFQTIIGWISGKIEPKTQDHSKATYTKIIKKEDGLINLDDDPIINYRKYLAYHHWPKVYFFTEENAKESNRKKRNIITEATFENNQFKIIKIIPEGKKETFYRSSNS
jgi:methionyl-tRNA formyltransferase